MYTEFIHRHGISVASAEAAIILAVLWDLWCLLGVQLFRRGTITLPLLSWIIYVFMALSSREPVPFAGDPEILFRLLNVVVLTVFHLFCNMGTAIVLWRSYRAEREKRGK